MKNDSFSEHASHCNDRLKRGLEASRGFDGGSVGNRRRDEKLSVCRSLGGPRLPVLTLLGSISREAKQ